MIKVPKLKIRVDDTAREQFWFEWASESYAIRNRFAHALDHHEDDPFAYNETPCVSVLSNAASRLGCLSLCDYREDKYHKDDRLKKSKGRIDLYVLRSNWHGAFEAKTLYNFRSFEIVEAKNNAVVERDRIVDDSNYDLRSAVVFANHFWNNGDSQANAKKVRTEYADADVEWDFPEYCSAARTQIFFWNNDR